MDEDDIRERSRAIHEYWAQRARIRTMELSQAILDDAQDARREAAAERAADERHQRYSHGLMNALDAAFEDYSTAAQQPEANETHRRQLLFLCHAITELPPDELHVGVLERHATLLKAARQCIRTHPETYDTVVQSVENWHIEKRSQQEQEKASEKEAEQQSECIVDIASMPREAFVTEARSLLVSVQDDVTAMYYTKARYEAIDKQDKVTGPAGCVTILLVSGTGCAYAYIYATPDDRWIYYVASPIIAVLISIIVMGVSEEIGGVGKMRSTEAEKLRKKLKYASYNDRYDDLGSLTKAIAVAERNVTCLNAVLDQIGRTQKTGTAKVHITSDDVGSHGQLICGLLGVTPPTSEP